MHHPIDRIAHTTAFVTSSDKYISQFTAKKFYYFYELIIIINKKLYFMCNFTEWLVFLS